MFTQQPLLHFRARPLLLLLLLFLLLLLLWNLSSFDLPFKGTGRLIDMRVYELLQANVINWKLMTGKRRLKHREMRETACCLCAIIIITTVGRPENCAIHEKNELDRIILLYCIYYL